MTDFMTGSGAASPISHRPPGATGTWDTFPLAMSAPKTFAPRELHRGLNYATYGEYGPGDLRLMPGCGIDYQPMWDQMRSFRWSKHRRFGPSVGSVGT